MQVKVKDKLAATTLHSSLTSHLAADEFHSAIAIPHPIFDDFVI
jgi:hypothetical protein